MLPEPLGRTPSRATGGPLQFTVTWDTAMVARPAYQAVVMQALAEWSAIVTDAGCITNPLPIHVQFLPLGGTFIGFCNSYVYGAGCIAYDTLTIGSNTAWFVDPTPGNDSEFAGPGPGPAGYDLLTVVRHEVGHGVGWGTGAQVDPYMMADSVFDQATLNIATSTATGLHVHDAWLPNDLMTPSIGARTRRPISLYPDASLIARSEGMRIPMHFVDDGGVGLGDGSATHPWTSPLNATIHTPAGWPILVGRGTQHTLTGTVFETPHTWSAARGGATIFAP
ncbi:MAG: hypothetical protein U0704_06150 [Candidatus Eisenbacteria bacterium]